MKKLLNSKWTAVEPKKQEKHFIITKVDHNQENSDIVDLITIQAIFTKQEYRMKPAKLKDSSVWLMGWK